MIRKTIKRGLKVQVEFNIGRKKHILDTYILEPDSDRLTLSFPESKREFAPYLREGTEIRAFIYTLTGIIILSSIVYDSPFDGAFVIEYNEEHHVIQRRKYLRMPFITDFFLLISDNNLKTATVDICGGGVRFVTDKHIVPTQTYKAQLRLNDFEPLIKMEGIVLKKKFFKANEYVIEFTVIDEQDREKIVQKCLALEKVLNAKNM